MSDLLRLVHNLSPKEVCAAACVDACLLTDPSQALDVLQRLAHAAADAYGNQRPAFVVRVFEHLSRFFPASVEPEISPTPSPTETTHA